MQGQAFSVVAKSASAVTIDNISVNYTNVGFPTASMKLLTVNYYDNYTFTGAATIPGTVESEAVSTNVKGLPTGRWVRILTTSAQTFAEVTTLFYDAKGRPIRSRISNSQLGGYTQADTKMDFDGTSLYVITRHKRTSSASEAELVSRNDFAYTAQDRLLSTTHTINNLSAELMSYNSYSAIGQLTGKSVGRTTSSPLQKITYAYNIRGWLTDINDVSSIAAVKTTPQDLFAFKINYTNTEGVAGVPALYNGNIAETTWKTGSDNIMRRYSYGYDNLNRLRDAYYQIPEAESPLRHSYDEHIKYDSRGNITRLKRNGGLDAVSPVVEIDNLVYTYTGNRLDKIVDSSTSPQGFKDVASPANDFGYDTLGNLTSDLNKGISANGIVYNHLNLPVSITFTGTVAGTISYIYDAAGVKLKKTVTNNSTSPATVTTTDYLIGFQYTNNVLDFFPTCEGYVKNTVVSGANNYTYVYQFKDHLGNVRVSYTLDPADNTLKIMEESHYYPFGLKHQGYSSNQNILVSGSGNNPNFITLVPVVNPGDVTYRYKYNGKEYQDELGLGFYDYGARNYDASIGRWMNIDPLASKYFSYSPYAYAINNPIYFVDIDGMQAGGPGDDESPAPTTKPGATELPEVIVTGKPTKSGWAWGTPPGLAWVGTMLPDLDRSLGDTFFGKNLYSAYENLSSTQGGRDFYKELHKNDERDGKLMMELLVSFVAPEIAIELIAELGSVALAGETVAVIEGSQEAIAVVVEGEEAAVVLEEGTTVFRAVDEVELASINKIGKFTTEGSDLEVKYFAKTLEDAHWYGPKLYPKGYKVVKGVVSSAVNAAEYWYPGIDIGAYVFPEEVLPYIIPH